jgi:hypothetical protein
MWIATLRDDAHHLRERAGKSTTASARKSLEKLATALSEAAAILESALPADDRPRASTRKKKKR